VTQEEPNAIDRSSLILELMPSLCAQAAADFTPTCCSVLIAGMFIEWMSAIRTGTSPLNSSS
jgi:hypothetical protein